MQEGKRLSRERRVRRSKITSTISFLASVITLLVAGCQLAAWMGVTITPKEVSELSIAVLTAIATLPLGIALWMLLTEGARWFFHQGSQTMRNHSAKQAAVDLGGHPKPANEGQLKTGQ